MKYEPFTEDNNLDDNVHNKLLSVRRPPFMNKPLVSLEWVTNGSRKRARPENPQEFAHPEPTSHAKRLAPKSNHVSPNDRRNALTPKLEDIPQVGAIALRSVGAAEIVRVVEKPARVEPITIMGGPPLVDDRVRQLVQFILHHVTSPNVEIEAKIGILFEKNQRARAIQLVPVKCETPINEESNGDVQFVSDVGQEMFSKLNKCLNNRVEETASHKEGMVRHHRSRDFDFIHRNKIRQTKRKMPNGNLEVIRTQRKMRLGDMNVLCPGSVFDVRYSASSEDDCSSPDGMPEMERDKDRISYKFDYLSLDITAVVSRSNMKKDEQTWEVEVEIDSSANLYAEVIKYQNGDDTSKLFDIASSLVNNVRIVLEQ